MIVIPDFLSLSRQYKQLIQSSSLSHRHKTPYKIIDQECISYVEMDKMSYLYILVTDPSDVFWHEISIQLDSYSDISEVLIHWFV